MNKETYEALKVVMNNIAMSNNATKQVESWIDEVAKEYVECLHNYCNDNAICNNCGEQQ